MSGTPGPAPTSAPRTNKDPGRGTRSGRRTTAGHRFKSGRPNPGVPGECLVFPGAAGALCVASREDHDFSVGGCGREPGGGSGDAASGVPATAQCRWRDGGSSLCSLLTARTGPAQHVITDHGPGEQRRRERHSSGNGHCDRETSCHSGRIFEGGAGKPRGKGKSRNRDHLAEARDRVVNGGSDPGVP
jgi:hypothetical protein